MVKITSTSTGFFDRAEYRIPLDNLIGEFKNHFPGAEELIFRFEEIPYYALSQQRKKAFGFSNDGKFVTILFDRGRYYHKGVPKECPSLQVMVSEFRYLMDKASEEYKSTFSTISESDKTN